MMVSQIVKASLCPIYRLTGCSELRLNEIENFVAMPGGFVFLYMSYPELHVRSCKKTKKLWIAAIELRNAFLDLQCSLGLCGTDATDAETVGKVQTLRDNYSFRRLTCITSKEAAFKPHSLLLVLIRMCLHFGIWSTFYRAFMTMTCHNFIGAGQTRRW